MSCDFAQTINETLKWPTQLPTLMQNHSGGDSVASRCLGYETCPLPSSLQLLPPGKEEKINTFKRKLTSCLQPVQIAARFIRINSNGVSLHLATIAGLLIMNVTTVLGGNTS